MYPIIRKKNQQQTIQQNRFVFYNHQETEYFTVPGFGQDGDIVHVFTTRVGGVSEGYFASLNFKKDDNLLHVLENYGRVAQIFQRDINNFVTTDQTHTTNIRVVNRKDKGKGVTIPRDYSDVDGLITNEKNLILSCFTADCVPILFYDPQRKVIGAVHSGWRGTVERIGERAVQIMYKEFQCDLKDIKVAIGPSICKGCYEISEDVAKRFKEGYWGDLQNKLICEKLYDTGLYPEKDWLTSGKEENKYQLDLWLANLVLLCRAGVLPENISVTDVCTCCNSDYLFSHRATGGNRGNLGAFIMLK